MMRDYRFAKRTSHLYDPGVYDLMSTIQPDGNRDADALQNPNGQAPSS